MPITRIGMAGGMPYRLTIIMTDKICPGRSPLRSGNVAGRKYELWLVPLTEPRRN